MSKITLKLTRYYGDVNITKSQLSIEDEAANVLFECEAREYGFLDYDLSTKDEKGELIKGNMYKCMPTGEFQMKVVSASMNPFCLKVHHARLHNGTIIVADSSHEKESKRIHIGFGKKGCKLHDVNECGRQYNDLVKEHYGDEFVLVVKNALEERKDDEEEDEDDFYFEIDK